MSLRLRLVLDGQPAVSDRVSVAAPPAAVWPFRTQPLAAPPDDGSVVMVADLHEAFVNHQTANTRLVTTQPIYQWLAWREFVGARDVLLLATADRTALTRWAPELLHGRGPFTGIEIVQSDQPTPRDETARVPVMGPDDVTAGEQALMAALRQDDPGRRLAHCVEALDHGRTPAALVAAASACMEVNDLEAAARDLDEAVMQAPDWAAAHYEQGKLWLRRDDMERASAAFERAAARLPDFGPAWANLGATLGELDRPDEALAAFSRALACDATSAQAHNNVAVVLRELGRLGESEAALRKVIELAPDLAVGYYNLGHTLFLQGRYQAALAAYVEGRRRDAELNAVQATRLAMCRLATGDAAGALRDLQQATSALPRDYRQQLLADTHTIAWALLTHRPDLEGWPLVNDWLTRELGR